MSMTEVKVETYCRRCGASNAAGNLSCSSCGTSLKMTIPLSSESAAVSHLAQLVQLLPGQLFQNRYLILSQVGTGGFGAVFKAEDKRTRRLVAIKAIGLQGLSPQEIIEATDAFNREVMLLSDLKHPSIPRMYEQFTDPEHWYLVMEFIEGETLETYRAKLATGCLPLERVLHIGIQLCNVLEYLHLHTPPIIFRDVKPGNIMLTSSGHVYLIDFGVARYFRPGKRKDTIAFGSPGFAAPEQYGKAQTTPRTDIYSLGVTLYQLLTGVDPSLTPFRFIAPRILDPTIPLELDVLLLRMMEMDANNRPANVAQVRQELQHVLDMQIQPAVSPASLPRPKQINFSTQGITRYIHRMHRQKVLSVSWSPDGKHIASAGEDHLVQVWEPFSGRDLFVYINHSKPVQRVAWAPDSKRIASASQDQTVHVWDATSGPRWLRSLALMTGFHYFAYEGHSGSVNAAAWSSNGLRIASGSDDNAVHIWEVTPQAQGDMYHGHTDAILTLAWSPDGRLIASSSLDHSLIVWYANGKNTVFRLKKSKTYFYALAWSPDGNFLAVGDSACMVKVWDVRKKHLLCTYSGHRDIVRAVAWSPDGRFIASGGEDSTVHIWPVPYHKGNDHAFIYQQHEDAVYTLAWSPDGQYLASAGEDRLVHVWQAV